MTDKQPEALRLADGLEQGFQTGSISAQLDQAAAELRRLHEVNAELLEALHFMLAYTADLNPMQGIAEYDHPAVNKVVAALYRALGEQQ